MITIDDKVYRNMQEQIAKNKEDIERLSSGVKIEYDVDTVAQLSQFINEEYVGKYIYCNEDSHLYLITKRQLTSGYDANDLGLYPACVKGAKGDTGATGENGSNGKGIVGIGSSVPNNDIGTDGDYYIVKLALHDYLYKKVGGVWVNKLDFKGSKGNDGCNVPVYANTGEAYSYTLTDIKVDGVVYMIPSLDDTSFTGTTTAENIIVSGDTVLNDLELLNGAYVTGNIIPNGQYEIGSQYHYWNAGYFDDIYISNELSVQDTITVNGVDLVNLINQKSVVSGNSSGSNWTSITINGTTKSISQGVEISTIDLNLDDGSTSDSVKHATNGLYYHKVTYIINGEEYTFTLPSASSTSIADLYAFFEELEGTIPLIGFATLTNKYIIIGLAQIGQWDYRFTMIKVI